MASWTVSEIMCLALDIALEERHKSPWRNGSMIENLKNISKTERPNELGLFWKEKTVVSCEGNPFIQFSCCRKERFKCFSTPKDSKCSKEDLDQADIKGRFLMVRIVKDWRGFSMEVVESPSCQVLKSRVMQIKVDTKIKVTFKMCPLVFHITVIQMQNESYIALPTSWGLS